MSEAAAERLIANGDFQEALSALASSALTVRARVLRAWAKFELGESQLALSETTAILKSRLDSNLQARCLAVRGRALARLGQGSEAISCLRRAVALAAETDAFLEADLRAQLATAALNWVGVEPALAELPGLRRCALESANHIALAEYHIAYARVAALSGWWQKTKTETHAAQELLLRFPHRPTQWRLHHSEASIAILCGDLPAALRHGQSGLELAEQSGSVSKKASAVANLAHIWSVAGNYEKSRSFLELSDRLLESDSQIRFATASTGIVVGLRSRDLALSVAMLERGLALRAMFREYTYYSLWFLLHHATWLIHAGLFAEAASRASEALEAAQKLADNDLSKRARLLRAEALSRDGQSLQALKEFCVVSQSSTEPTIELLAEMHRVRAVICYFFDESLVEPSLDAARRILRTAGLHGALDDVERTASTLAARGVTRGARVDPDELITMVASTATLGRYPDVLATELLAVLNALNLSGHSAVWRHDSNGRHLLAHYGQPPKDTQDLQAVNIAGLDGTSFRVEVSPKHNERFTFLRLALEKLARCALQAARASHETEPPAPWPFEPGAKQHGLITASDAMSELLSTVKRLAPSIITVLITGETGTGKELLARALHDASPRSRKPYIPFNCSAVSREMLDAQLFGYRKGAFTGASEAFPGVIRAATGGTLFLDEIGEMSLEVQPKLLRFLESGEIHPLGEPRPIHVDVRVVAATNADLEAKVEQGTFREDLFYRLNVVRLQVPPLRDRREEIPPLVQHFLDKCSRESQKSGLRIADETMEYLILFKWPGNVRQLANEMRRMVALAEPGAVLMPEHLSHEIAASRRTIPASERYIAPTEFVVRMDQPIAAAIEHLERSMIQYALKLSGGRLEDAARRLGLSRKGLYLKRQRLQIEDAFSRQQDDASPDGHTSERIDVRL